MNELTEAQRVNLLHKAARIIGGNLESKWLNRKCTEFMANSLNFLDDMTAADKPATERQKAWLLRLYDIAAEDGPIGWKQDGKRFELLRKHVELL